MRLDQALEETDAALTEAIACIKEPSVMKDVVAKLLVARMAVREIRVELAQTTRVPLPEFKS